MRTNLEKFNYYKSIIDAREKKYAESFFPSLPKLVYQVNHIGVIEEISIGSLGYYNKRYFYFHKKPTKKQVEDIKKFSEEDYEFCYNEIRIFYSHGNKSCGAYSPDRFKETFKTKEEAEEKAEEIIQLRIYERSLLENGHFRCNYCSKITQDDKKVIAKIYGKGTGPNGKAASITHDMEFCSGTCASHEQMSREG